MKIRKIVALSMVMIFALFSANMGVKAASAFIISGTETTVEAGEQATIDLVMEGNPGFSALNLYYTYDTQYLTLESVVNKVSSFAMTHVKTTVWDAANNYTKDGTLATLNFKVAENAPAGEYKVNIMFLSASNDSFEAVEVQTKEATITVQGEGSTSSFLISGTNVQTKAGNQVTVDLVLEGNPGISALNLYYTYDTDYLTLESVENKMASFTMTHVKTTVWDAASNVTEDGILATLTFSVAENAPAGEYKINVMFLSASNDSFEAVEVQTKEATISVELDALRISRATLKLQNDITVVFKAEASIIDGIYNNCFVEVVQEKENGESEKQSIIGSKSSDGLYYEFKYNGVNAKEVGDAIDITIYAYDTDGELVTGETKEDYSVKSYCFNQLASTDAELAAQGLSTEKANAFRTLLVDLLNYSSEAQKYFGYKTENLVNADLTETQKAYASSDEILNSLQDVTNTEYVKIEEATSTWKSAGLNLLSKNTVRVKFSYMGNIDDVTMIVKVQGGTEAEITEFVSGGNGEYNAFFDEITAYQFGNPIDFTLQVDGSAISNTLRYSVESYALKNKDDSAVGNIVSAMMKYGEAAVRYDTVD